MAIFHLSVNNPYMEHLGIYTRLIYFTYSLYSFSSKFLLVIFSEIIGIPIMNIFRTFTTLLLQFTPWWYFSNSHSRWGPVAATVHHLVSLPPSGKWPPWRLESSSRPPFSTSMIMGERVRCKLVSCLWIPPDDCHSWTRKNRNCTLHLGSSWRCTWIELSLVLPNC